jgi:hypothetical protein
LRFFVLWPGVWHAICIPFSQQMAVIALNRSGDRRHFARAAGLAGSAACRPLDLLSKEFADELSWKSRGSLSVG